MSGDTLIFEGGATCCGDCTAWCAHTKWRITTSYIEREKGTCCTTVDNLQLIRIKDIHYDTGKCCCGCCGSITILSSDQTDPELIISGIPDSHQVYNAIRDAWGKATSSSRIQLEQR